MFDKIFNSGTAQSILLVIAGASAGLDKLLEWLGCTYTTAGAQVCLPENVPTWFPEFLTPYLPVVAAIAAGLALVYRFAKGTAATPSAPISSSGAAGTVTQKQVDSVSVTAAPKKG
jgi:hypothetical protein